jgi:hypothetical protein
MERLGFYVCVEDLEDELIRAIGAARVEELIDSQGDLGSFRSLQRQPEWRGQPAGAQLRRFLGSGARRKLRYARLLAGAVGLDRLPHPLEALLTWHNPPCNKVLRNSLGTRKSQRPAGRHQNDRSGAAQTD